MLYLPRQPLDTRDHLKTALTHAIAVELSTIPPYLTALFSIKPGANAAAAAIIRSVVIEEMLHLSLACNILNAVGGHPDLPAALLRYPSPLPMCIGDRPGHRLVVPLARLSETSIATFMTIEEPEFPPIQFPDDRLAATAQDDEEYHTIGQFYTGVSQLISKLGPAVFKPHRRQVTGWIGPDPLTAITSVQDAQNAIETIIDQGEGTASSPAANPEELAHYYRFEQIQRQRTLTPDPDSPEGYVWGNPEVGLTEDGIWPMIGNPPLVPLPDGTQVARMSDQFDATFTRLIDELQRTFTGSPQSLPSALAQMHALRLQAARLMPLEVPGRRGTAGPRFIYVGA